MVFFGGFGEVTFIGRALAALNGEDSAIQQSTSCP